MDVQLVCLCSSSLCDPTCKPTLADVSVLSTTIIKYTEKRHVTVLVAATRAFKMMSSHCVPYAYSSKLLMAMTRHSNLSPLLLVDAAAHLC